MAKRGRKKISVEEAEEYLMETDPVVLATDPRMKGKIHVGEIVTFMLPKFSRLLSAMMRSQLESGKVKKYGEIVLDDGTLLEINKSYSMPLTFQIKDMLKKGMLMGGGKSR
jgi:hypothetical protein